MAEPTILGPTPTKAGAEAAPQGAAGTALPASASLRGPRATSRPSSRGATAPPRVVVTVAGFWRRALAAGIDALVVLPAAFLLAWLASKLAGVSLPDARHSAPDYWLDLAIAGEPALWGTIGLVLAIAVIYLFLFHMTVARTLGMRVCRLRVIDVYGEPPSVTRAALRTLGYLASAATLGLGFVWVGFDGEKRGLHDWIAGTYVIRSQEGASQA